MMLTTLKGAGWTTDMDQLQESVIGFEPLYDSMFKCKKGVLWKDSTASYYLNGLERTVRLCEELHTGKYRARPPVRFRITSPKPRDISSIAFRDRVYQRSLNDNAVYPIMSRSFIHANFACQKGKGTDAARKQLKEDLRWYFRRYGCQGFVAQFDIHGYYPNMDHAATERLFRRKLPPEIYAMVERILREQYTGAAGYDPGSQLIQIAGISMLDGWDHYAKEQLHARLYLRYMDDFLIISQDRAYLEDCVCKAQKYLAALRFELNPKKTRIFPLSEGIDFLGFRFFLSESGKVIMRVRPESVKRQRRKLRRLAAKSKRGALPRSKVDASYAAWRNHAGKGNSYKLLQRMDAFYLDLWRDEQ